MNIKYYDFETFQLDAAAAFHSFHFPLVTGRRENFVQVIPWFRGGRCYSCDILESENIREQLQFGEKFVAERGNKRKKKTMEQAVSHFSRETVYDNNGTGYGGKDDFWTGEVVTMGASDGRTEVRMLNL